MSTVTLFTATTAPLPHEQAMAAAIATLAPDWTIHWSTGSTAALLPGSFACPLTLDNPLNRTIDAYCRDRAAQQTLVQERWQIVPCEQGNLWLPIVWTAKGPLYAEVIHQQAATYVQPFHLRDHSRQLLYRFAFQLLSYYGAPPSVYTLALRWDDLDAQGTIEMFEFEQLWPFPQESAIASLGVQQPDLFHCHWLCLTEQPIYDLKIMG